MKKTVTFKSVTINFIKIEDGVNTRRTLCSRLINTVNALVNTYSVCNRYLNCIRLNIVAVYFEQER